MGQVFESYLPEWRISDSSSLFLSLTDTHTQHTHLPPFGLWYLHRDLRDHLGITAPEVRRILSAVDCMGEVCWYLAATSGFCERDRRRAVCYSDWFGWIKNFEVQWWHFFHLMSLMSFGCFWWSYFEIFYSVRVKWLETNYSVKHFENYF